MNASNARVYDMAETTAGPAGQLLLSPGGMSWQEGALVIGLTLLHRLAWPCPHTRLQPPVDDTVTDHEQPCDL
ncbi:hypothetical protein ACFYNY_07135 [Streptomyces sp. NPDC006530]|uniref:hypothetical protein n=1 Tax=Streptomyces sp. NPDC006530 TaxID=3364750 RepID=UPI00368943D1